MWAGPFSALSTGGYRPDPANMPCAQVPQADLSQQVARHLGMRCGCLLLDCCHNEMPEDNYAFTPGHGSGYHIDSGSPASGYLYPWEPGDDSWRDAPPLAQFGVADRERKAILMTEEYGAYRVWHPTRCAHACHDDGITESCEACQHMHKTIPRERDEWPADTRDAHG